MTAIRPEQWKEGLLVRSPNWLGDLVMAFPALMLLKRLLPEFCTLTVICPAGLAPVLDALTETVDEIVPVADPHAFPTRREMAPLLHRHFGAGILFNNSLRDAVVMRYLGVKPLYGAAARGRSILLREPVTFPKRVSGQLNPPHQAKRCLEVAKKLGIGDWDGVSMPAIHPDFDARRFELAFERPFPDEKHPVLAVAPGAAFGDAKRWDAGAFHAVADHWQRKRNGFVILLGSKTEAPICEKCAEGLMPSLTLNLAGKTSLHALMFVLKHAAYCVANDSGIMHLAAAIGTPGTAVFGSTDMAATGPLSPKWNVLYRKEPCSPCFKHVCPLGTRACMKAIKVADVLKTLPKP